MILLDDAGHAVGTAPKASVHQAQTPLHLAFSCYLFDESARLLMSRRALSKATFPGLWTNTACGHPGPGESAEAAAVRRVHDELGLAITAPRLVLPGFRYRATMDGIEEHEWCPVLVGTLPSAAQVRPDPDEVDSVTWIEWPSLIEQVFADSASVSPWCAEQVQALAELGPDPDNWPTGDRSALPPALRGIEA